MRRPLALAVALLLVLPAAGDEAQIKTKLADAKAKSAAKEHRAADLAFAAVAQEALAGKLDTLAKDANQHRADNLKTWAADPNVPAADRQFACNNLGVLLLRDGDGEGAVKVYERVPEPKGEGAYLYLANHARALEKAGRTPEALRMYGASLNADPRFALAAERAASLLVSDAKLTPAERRAGARALLDTPGLPASVLRSATALLLTAWKNDEAAEDVLPFVVRYLALSGTTASGFDRNEAKPFAEWESSDRLKSRLVELRGVYESCKFASDVKLLDTNIGKTLPAWTEGLHAVPLDFARVLAGAGDDFARRARALAGAKGKDEERRVLARGAAQRYALAATISADDTRSLVAAVGVVLEHRDQLDPNWALLDRYVTRLFEAKNSIYQYGKLTPADYRSLGGLHVALATILEAKGERWGTSQFGALSVEFQFEKAIWVEEQLRKPGAVTDYPASPALRERLAEARLKVENKAGAARALRDAVDLYLTLGNTDQATKTLDRYLKLRPPTKGEPPVDARLAELVTGAKRALKHDYETKDRPRAVAFLSADLVGVGADGQMAGWKLKEGEKGTIVSTEAWHGNLIAAASKTGDFVCSAGDGPDRSVDWWKVENGKAVRQWSVAKHTKSARGLAISDDGKFAASVDAEGEFLVYDTVKGGRVLNTAPFAVPQAVAFRKPSELVVAGKGANGKGAVALVSLGGEKNGRLVWSTEREAEAASAAASDDGRFVAAGFVDGTITVFDAATGKPVKSFAHPGAVRSVAFVPRESRLIATLGSDQSARLWLATDGREMARFGNPRPPVGMSFSPDGKLLALALDEFAGGRVRVWEVPKAPVK